MAVGKRMSTSDPLTEHDVAERLTHSVDRTLRILMDVRQTPGLFEEVLASRYLPSGMLEMLAAELLEWGVDPALAPAPSDANRPPTPEVMILSCGHAIDIAGLPEDHRYPIATPVKCPVDEDVQHVTAYALRLSGTGQLTLTLSGSTEIWAE